MWPVAVVVVRVLAENGGGVLICPALFGPRDFG
jgi:hypothetical protein